jgi:hypothetical protein
LRGIAAVIIFSAGTKHCHYHIAVAVPGEHRVEGETVPAGSHIHVSGEVGSQAVSREPVGTRTEAFAIGLTELEGAVLGVVDETVGEELQCIHHHQVNHLG